MISLAGAAGSGMMPFIIRSLVQRRELGGISYREWSVAVSRYLDTQGLGCLYIFVSGTARFPRTVIIIIVAVATFANISISTSL